MILKSTGLCWSSCEIYVCGDPDCRSKVLVLQPPAKDPRRPELPRCVCGSVLEIEGSVSGMLLPPAPVPTWEQGERE